MTGRDRSRVADVAVSASAGSDRSSLALVRPSLDVLARTILVGLGVGLVVMADPSEASVGLIAAGILAIGASLVGWSD